MRTHDNEPFVLRRDVKAVMVPAGIEGSETPCSSAKVSLTVNA